MSEVTAVPIPRTRRGILVALWIGVAALVAGGVALGWSGTRAAVAAGQTPEEFLADNGKRRGVVTTPSGLQYEVVKAAAGERPGATDFVLVDYDGRLVNGEQFDASAKTGGPVPMQVDRVVPGFSEALQLMPKGAKYRFWLPPALGYGDRPAGPIPANSVLVFDVTLHEIASASALRAMGAAPGM